MSEGSLCVLVVDDDVDVRDTLRDVVEMGGCHAVTAANGAEALLLLKERRPCLVIVDLVMPVMSGNELIEAIRARPELSGVPILVSTSVPDRAPAGLPVLPKPVDINALWSWMRQSCTCGEAASSG